MNNMQYESAEEAATKMLEGVSKIKSALVELEKSVLNLIHFQDYEASNDDYMEAFKYHENKESLLEDGFDDFRELIREQDKKLESIANMVNRGLR